MKGQKGYLVVVIAFLLLACPAAFADGFTFEFHGGATLFALSIDGAPDYSVWGGPYQIEISPGGSIVPMVCIDGAILFDGDATYSPSSGSISNQVAWIVSQMIGGNYTANELIGMQLAVWELMDGTSKFEAIQDGSSYIA